MTKESIHAIVNWHRKQPQHRRVRGRLEAAGTVKEKLGDDSPDFVFVFSTIGYEHQDILDAVVERPGDVPKDKKLLFRSG